MLTDEQKAELRAIIDGSVGKQRDADATAQDANATAIATAVRAERSSKFRDDDLPGIIEAWPLLLPKRLMTRR